MAPNADHELKLQVDGDGPIVRGIGSFHKTLPHNPYGEVDEAAFELLNRARAVGADGAGFALVPPGWENSTTKTDKLVNPQAGLASDRLIHHPEQYSMPPAPPGHSETTAAEMTELYWMALLRDVPLDQLEAHEDAGRAAAELEAAFARGMPQGPEDMVSFKLGVDLPGSSQARQPVTPQNLFRLGLPGEDRGPYVSQLFLRPCPYGTQTIDQQQQPYAKNADYLTDFDAWLHAQNSGRDLNSTDRDPDGQGYGHANEDAGQRFEAHPRYISTLRDLARFVNKDALHQAYFNAALLLVGNVPFAPGLSARRSDREAGFGVLGGPHLLALVSEVATRALKVVWHQKWQVHLRQRPEAYGGLLHVQEVGVGIVGAKRAYRLPAWVATTAAAQAVRDAHGGLLLPMAFTSGSPAHPAYGAGHATVAGACVTILKAFFETYRIEGGQVALTPFVYDPATKRGVGERSLPYGAFAPMKAYITGLGKHDDGLDIGTRTELPSAVAQSLTLEGELNKLAMNVAMGRSIGGVHWRTDNSRSLALGEAIAAEILAGITTDVNLHEAPIFTFRTFRRGPDGEPSLVRIEGGEVSVDGAIVTLPASAL